MKYRSLQRMIRLFNIYEIFPARPGHGQALPYRVQPRFPPTAISAAHIPDQQFAKTQRFSETIPEDENIGD